MDLFYDIISNAQQEDPEFKALSNKSAGTLTRRLIETGNYDDDEGSMFQGSDDDSPVFQVTLNSDGRLSIGYSGQISPDAILHLLDHVREVVEENRDD